MALTPEEETLLVASIDKIKAALNGSLSDTDAAKVLNEIVRPINGTSGFTTDVDAKESRLNKEIFQNEKLLRSLGMHI